MDKLLIGDFEGPLDVLLHLIKESKMDIMDIDVVSLTNQYLNFINSMEDNDITIASEYLTLASELIYLKSRYLLPQDKDDEDDEEYVLAKENLVNRLIEYKNYKEMTSVFKSLEEKRGEVFTKVPSNLSEYASQNQVMVGGDVSLNDLLDAFKKYLDRSLRKTGYEVMKSIKSFCEVGNELYDYMLQKESEGKCKKGSEDSNIK